MITAFTVSKWASRICWLLKHKPVPALPRIVWDYREYCSRCGLWL